MEGRSYKLGARWAHIRRDKLTGKKKSPERLKIQDYQLGPKRGVVGGRTLLKT